MQENVEGAGCRNCASYKRNVSVGIICLESDVVPQVYTPRVYIIQPWRQVSMIQRRVHVYVLVCICQKHFYR